MLKLNVLIVVAFLALNGVISTPTGKYGSDSPSEAHPEKPYKKDDRKPSEVYSKYGLTYESPSTLPVEVGDHHQTTEKPPVKGGQHGPDGPEKPDKHSPDKGSHEPLKKHYGRSTEKNAHGGQRPPRGPISSPGQSTDPTGQWPPRGPVTSPGESPRPWGPWPSPGPVTSSPGESTEPTRPWPRPGPITSPGNSTNPTNPGNASDSTGNSGNPGSYGSRF